MRTVQIKWMPWPMCLIILVFGTFILSQYVLIPRDSARVTVSYDWKNVVENRKKLDPIKIILEYEANKTRNENFPIDKDMRIKGSVVQFKSGILNVVPLYFVTVLNSTKGQNLELYELSSELALLPNLTWIVVQDGPKVRKDIARLLKYSRVKNYRYITILESNLNSTKKRIQCLNEGLEWVKNNARTGVVYFGDVDNVYETRFFEEVATTKKVSMFPVGLRGSTVVVTPILDNYGGYIGFYGIEDPPLKFPILVENFAVSVEFILGRPDASFSYDTFTPEAESFLQSLDPFEPNEAEFLGKKCTEVLVWSMKSPENSVSLTDFDVGKYRQTNLVPLYKNTFLI